MKIIVEVPDDTDEMSIYGFSSISGLSRTIYAEKFTKEQLQAMRVKDALYDHLSNGLKQAIDTENCGKCYIHKTADGHCSMTKKHLTKVNMLLKKPSWCPFKKIDSEVTK